MYAEVIDKNKIRRELKSSSKDIRNLTSDSSSLLMSSNVCLRDNVQKYISHIPGNKLKNQIIKPIILDAVFRSETHSGGSGEMCLQIISSLVDEFLRKNHLGYRLPDIKIDLDKKMSHISAEISKHSKRLTRKDINKIIDDKFVLKIQKTIVKEVIERAGIFTPLTLKISNKQDTFISFSKGFKFKIGIERDFLLGKNSWKRVDVSCVVIDGFIESTSEIHHLLEKISSTREACVIFVRHLSDEVRSTILLNLQRGTIDLIPVEVGFDENTLNILNDISICCNSDLVSSLKGDTISAACRKDFDKIDKIEITENGFEILNSNEDEKLRSHIDYLKEKMNSSKNPEITSLLKDRLESILSEEIKILMGKNLISRDRQSIEKFDTFFRELQTYIKYGIVYSDDLKLDHTGIKLRPDLIYSGSSIYFSSMHAFSAIRSLLSMEKAILSK